jgi:hypothetical protein
MKGDTSMETSGLQRFAKIWPVLSWVLSAYVAFQCVLTTIVTIRIVPIFADMLRAVQVELPWPTRLLLATYYWSLPIFFFLLILLVIGKEFAIKENRRKFVVTGEVFLAAVFTPGLVILILYLPLFVLIRKLSEAN